MGGWVTLLGMDEVWELGGVSQEEDGGVICHDIPVALFSPHLDSETTRITGAVMGTRLATNSRESNSHRAFLALGGENVGVGKVVKRVSAGEDTMGAATLGVDNTLCA